MFELFVTLCLQAFIALDASLLKGRMEHRMFVRKYWPDLWEAFSAYYDDPREKVATSLVTDTPFEDVLQRGHESGTWTVISDDEERYLEAFHHC